MSGEREKAVAVSYIRRRVSVSAVKGLSLLGRLEVLGPGTKAAAGRRRWAQMQEQRWRKGWKANIKNINLKRRKPNFHINA